MEELLSLGCKFGNTSCDPKEWSIFSLKDLEVVFDYGIFYLDFMNDWHGRPSCRFYGDQKFVYKNINKFIKQKDAYVIKYKDLKELLLLAKE